MVGEPEPVSTPSVMIVGTGPGRVLLPPPGNRRGLEVASGPVLEAAECTCLLDAAGTWQPADSVDAAGVEVAPLNGDVLPLLQRIARQVWEMNATLWQLTVRRVHPGDPPILVRRPPHDGPRDALDMAIVPHRKISCRLALDQPLTLDVAGSQVRLSRGEMAAWPAYLPWREPAVTEASIELGLWVHGPALR